MLVEWLSSTCPSCVQVQDDLLSWLSWNIFSLLAVSTTACPEIFTEATVCSEWGLEENSPSVWDALELKQLETWSVME